MAIGNPVLRLIVAVAKFSRPHTVYGTVRGRRGEERRGEESCALRVAHDVVVVVFVVVAVAVAPLLAAQTVSVLSISFVAASCHPEPAALLHWSLGLKPMVVSLVSALLANVSIVGLNQIYDVKIDKVNKPYLPLASGEISLR